MGSAPQASRPLRVLVVDSHDASRVGITLMLRRAEGIADCVAAANDERALALAREHRPDVAVIDVSERGPFTEAITAALRRVVPGLRFVLTSHCANSAPAPIQGARPGVFVPAEAGMRGLVEAVTEAPGEGEPAAAPTGVLAALTEREREVLEWIATGFTNREIAARVHLSPETVKKHASTIFRKLGVRNRTEAAHLAREALLA
jgi:DNA-binding NarL/FixJ family response regulator